MAKRPSRRIPKYCLHKGTGQAVVTLDGRDLYLGRHGTAKSRELYDRLISEWLAAGRKIPIQAGPGMTVTELCAAYWRHAQAHYRKRDGTATTQIHVVKQVIRDVRRVYGSMLSADFGPKALAVMRQIWIDCRHRDGGGEPTKPLARKTVNNLTSQLKLIFKWGVAQELVPASVYEGLRAVAELSAGRSGARETEPVKPVPEAHVNTVKPYVSLPVWAVIQLQLLTAARGGELLIMRAVDLDTSGKIWLYNPPLHKTLHHGKERVIFIGPQAREIIKPFLKHRAVDEYMFCPREAAAELKARKAKGTRRANQKPNPRKTDRTVGDHYTSASYRRAIERACDEAGVPRWTPHRLRHSAATFIRKEFGLEEARVILGHSHAGITELYAERDQNKAIEVISKIG